MKAFILAAGLGTRLRPLTDEKPKALITAGGKTLLEITMRRLMAAGADDFVVNLHHFPEQIEEFLRANNNFGAKVSFSYEREKPLETGGGLKHAAPLLDGPEPFFVHNADVYTEMDLRAMYKAHLENGAVATLAVMDRPTTRKFLFDNEGRLRGWRGKEETRWAHKPCKADALAFSGVHVISPAIFPKLTEEGVFSMTDVYLRLAKIGERIRPFRADGTYWADIGTPEKLAALEARLSRTGLKLD